MFGINCAGGMGVLALFGTYAHKEGGKPVGWRCVVSKLAGGGGGGLRRRGIGGLTVGRGVRHDIGVGGGSGAYSSYFGPAPRPVGLDISCTAVSGFY